MLPTFFVIGASKTGTTSLAHYLGLHPEIHMAPWKEPHFFVKPGDGLATLDNRIFSTEEYEALFESDLAVRGEGSTSYSHYPARGGVPERIKEWIPDARFIYLVRDPVDRIVSHYVHQVAWGGERRPLVQTLGDLDHPHNVFISASRYATQVERYLRIFPEDRMLVVDSDELRSHRTATLTEVFAFLGVDSRNHAADSAPEVNVTAGQRVLPDMYSRLRHRGPLRRLPAPLRRRLQRLGERAEQALLPPVQQPEVPDSLRLRLSDMFSAEVNRLRALTGKPFATWSL